MDMSSSLSSRLGAQFYADFPALRDTVAFCDDRQSITRLACALGVAEKDINDRIEKLGDRSVCTHMKYDGKDFFLINARNIVVPDFGSLALRSLDTIEQEVAEEFIFHHETGHIVFHAMDPYDYDQKDEFWYSKRDVIRRHMSEAFSDTYAALQCLRSHGEDARPSIWRQSDLRMLFAVSKGNLTHFSTPVLDEVLRGYKWNDDIKPLQDMPAPEIAMIARQMVRDYAFTPEEKAKLKTQCDKAMETISAETQSYTGVRRFLEAVQRQVILPTPRLADYFEGLGLSMDEISEDARHAPLLKAIVALDISLFDADEMDDVSAKIETAIMGDELGESNRYPGLSDFAKNANRAFVGDRYQRLAALSDPRYACGIAGKYLTAQRLREIQIIVP